MNRQNASKKMFGLVMITVTLLLVACGSGDGDSDPTATSAANEAVPTLPSEDGTAEVSATGAISEEDLTVVEPEIPATAEETEEVSLANVGTPAEGTPASTPPAGSVVETPAASTSTVAVTQGSPEATESATTAVESTPVEQVTDLTGAPIETAIIATPAASPGTTEPTDEVVLATPTETPTTTETEGTPGVEEAPEAPASTPGSTPDQGHFNEPGDGTGGSGQPGEPSSNVGNDSVTASPVAGIAIEGCEVSNVPTFEDEVVDYITVAEVNFRSGPGTDCDPILEEPLAPEVAVVVIGGPVTQTSDDTVWLQVEVDGVPGWVSQEFIEPAG